MSVDSPAARSEFGLYEQNAIDPPSIDLATTGLSTARSAFSRPMDIRAIFLLSETALTAPISIRVVIANAVGSAAVLRSSTLLTVTDSQVLNAGQGYWHVCADSADPDNLIPLRLNPGEEAVFDVITAGAATETGRVGFLARAYGFQDSPDPLLNTGLPVTIAENRLLNMVEVIAT